MALLDFLKNKKEAEKAKEKKVSEKKTEKGSVTPKKAEKKAEAKPAVTVKAGKFSFEAVREPHISEKATYLAEKDQYTFRVSPNFNKNEIKKAVEGVYGVNVLSVNMIKIPRKKRRLGRTEGFKKAYVKAVVKIKQGQKIEIL
jgi:large subunit ribosomal protein L23